MKDLILSDGRTLTPAAQCAIATRWGNPRMYGKPTRQMRETSKLMAAATRALEESEQATLDAALIEANPPLSEARMIARQLRVTLDLELAGSDAAINALKTEMLAVTRAAR